MQVPTGLKIHYLSQTDLHDPGGHWNHINTRRTPRCHEFFEHLDGIWRNVSAKMYGCESWTIRKAEHWRIDTFELWCWRRLLRVSSTARRSNQSLLKEITPEYSLEGLMLKLKLQYFGLTYWEGAWCWERLKARGEGDNRGWDGWMASPTQWTWVWACLGSCWWTGKLGMLQSLGSRRVGHDWVTELNWTVYQNICTAAPSGSCFHWTGFPRKRQNEEQEPCQAAERESKTITETQAAWVAGGSCRARLRWPSAGKSETLLKLFWFLSGKQMIS